MAIPKASTDLHGYKAWRNSLVPFEIGTVFRFMKKYSGSTKRDDINEGSYWVITGIREPYTTKDTSVASKVYILNACSSKGKPTKRIEYLDVEGIAKWLDEGVIMIVGENNV